MENERPRPIREGGLEDKAGRVNLFLGAVSLVYGISAGLVTYNITHNLGHAFASFLVVTPMCYIATEQDARL
ncbi:MAG: hypothetical protein KJ600_02395 [Nanoarchaeota archaeon]|nr:hypothetical protein [Nanoarchaeota archaeon]MBU1103383.1 hypothetical protein [Nanoarchaeota archaeon]